MTPIAALIPRLAQLTHPSPDLDREIAVALHLWLADLPASDAGGWIHPEYELIAPPLRYTLSVDAALTLVGSRWYLLGAGKTRPDEPLYGAQVLEPISLGSRIIGEGESDVNQAIAICIAALQAMEAPALVDVLGVGAAQ